ncbi:hypothetical protein SKAU_G00188880 [Synaphobranchus kaupii]|uniref:CD109 antigen n=1 Tax=Synaphobranchus kaupii TaxID=118154 RepID=A0A9Q1IW60_SYNKA|nr:hypothetical protein SKAU_G00188880 [Synaphobranchus kaupii]
MEALTPEDRQRTVTLTVTQNRYSPWNWRQDVWDQVQPRRPNASRPTVGPAEPGQVYPYPLFAEDDWPEPETLTLPVPASGVVPIHLQLSDDVATLHIEARFRDSTASFVLYSSYSSPSKSYIQIRRDQSPAQVISKGQVVAAGTMSSASFTLTPDESWAPQAFVVVYCVRTDGEIINDAMLIPIAPVLKNNVTLSWSRALAKPGERVTLGVSVTEPGSLVGILVVDQVTKWPKQDNDITLEAVLEELTEYKTDRVSGPEGIIMRSDPYSIFKDFFLSLYLPVYIIRGEQLVMEVNLFNYLPQELEVMVIVAESESFEFVFNTSLSMASRQTVYVGSQDSTTVRFPIRPKILGEILISVEAFSSISYDSLKRKVLVKPEGLEQSFSKSLFLELAPSEDRISREIVFTFPPGVVQGSKRAEVAVVGDILGPSITGLESLIQLPYGCGEQNMIHFAPNIYVLQYLTNTQQVIEDIRNKAISFMRQGYQQELSYQREDGSFSAFGNSDSSGSTWLSAFVLRCFLQARPFISIDPGVLSSTVAWLVDRQRPDGAFLEPGRVIHTELQGGLDGPVALTAYVLTALLEEHTYASVYGNTVSKALGFLEGKLASGIYSNYSLCLVVYALSLADHSNASAALTELINRADVHDNVMSWSSSGAGLSDLWQPRSSDIEMAAYVLLSLFKQAMVDRGIPLLKWLIVQRTHLGGYGSTQICKFPPPHASGRANCFHAPRRNAAAGLGRMRRAVDADASTCSQCVASDKLIVTVSSSRVYSKNLLSDRIAASGSSAVDPADTIIALQALSWYAAFSGSAAIDLSVEVVRVPSLSEASFQIDSTNYLLRQSLEIEAERDIHIEVSVEGRGFAILQLNVFYNLESGGLSRKRRDTAEQEGFYLSVNVIADEWNTDHFTITVCTRLLANQGINQTGMALMEVGLLSGFSLAQDGVETSDLVKKVETSPGKVVLYLDSVTQSLVCVRIPTMRDFKVAHVQDVAVVVYDYYVPLRKATRMYNSKAVSGASTCSFCGDDCSLCGGMDVPVYGGSSPTRSATYAPTALLLAFLASAF